MIYQLGFSHKLENYKQNWNKYDCGDKSQESLDSLRKLIYEVGIHYGDVLKEFDKWIEEEE